MTTGHFQQDGAAYARYRPSYPDDLAAKLAALAPERGLALDVGCGTGQLACLLADHFNQVLATDVSASQIEAATRHPGVRYAVEPCDAISAANGTVALTTVAQAAHWFDLPAFYAEVRRVSLPGALLALITYGVTRLSGPARDRFDHFYWEELRPYWPAERRHVENGYADLPFPFDPVEPPACQIERSWPLDALLGYVGTWSATKRARDAGQGAMIERFKADAAALWGDPASTVNVVWPISIRLGSV